MTRPGHDDQCESELTSHGYTPCRCEDREQLVICACGRAFYRSETVTDECETCYELRRGL